MADLTQKSSLGVEAETDNESTTPSISDADTTTDVTPSASSEKEVSVNQGAGEILEASERDIATRAVFQDAKIQEDHVFNKNENEREGDVSSSGAAYEDLDDLQCKDLTHENREDSLSISRPANEDNGDINAELTNVRDREATDSIAHVIVTSHPADEDVVASASHSVRDSQKNLKKEGVESSVTTESFSESNDGVHGAGTELSANDANDASVKKETSDETVNGVTDDDGVTGEQAKEEAQQTFGQGENLSQTKFDQSDEPSSKSISEIQDVSCDESFEDLGEIGSAFDLTTGHKLCETIEVAKGREQVVKEVDERHINEEEEQAWSSEVETALSEAMEKVLNEGEGDILSETIEQTMSEPIEQTLNEPIEQTLNELKEQTLNEPIEQTLSEPIEQTLSEPIEQTSSEPVEQTLSEPIEQTSSEPVEQTLSEPIEQTSSEPVEQTLSEVSEQSSNEGLEKASNGSNEKAINKAVEKLLNEAKEGVLNESEEQSLNERKELSFGANEPVLSSPEKKIGHKYSTSKSTDVHVEESSDNLSGQTAQETGQPLKDIGKVAEAKTKDVQASGNSNTDIPMSEHHGTEEGVAPERQIRLSQLHWTEESVTPEGGDAMTRIRRVAEDMVTALVSEACCSADGKVSATVMSASVQNGKTPTLQCLEHGEAKSKFTSSSGGTYHRDDVSSNVAEVDKVNEVTSPTPTIGTEEIDLMASYKTIEHSEYSGLSPDTEVDDVKKLNSYNSKKDIEGINVKESYHSEATTEASDQTRGDDTPYAETGVGEEAIDHPSSVKGSQCITTSTTQPPDDEKQGRVPESLPNFDATKLNDDTLPENSRPTKDNRGICMTALKLSGVVLTGFGCAFAAPFAIAALGFEAGGIAAGSLAAGWMSAASSSGVGLLIVSALETAGISGLGLGAQVLIGAAGAGTAGGLVAAAELFKRKSTNEEAAHAYGKPQKGAGDASEDHFEEEEANNNEDVESENNDDNSFDEDTSDKSTDDVMADIQNGVTQMEDSDRHERDENKSNVEAIKMKDTLQHESNQEDAQENGAVSRRVDNLVGDAAMLCQDVDPDVQINDQPHQGKDQHGVLGDVSEAEDRQPVVADDLRCALVRDDLPVNLSDEFPEETYPVGNPDDSSSGGVMVEPHGGGGDDDYTDNPWKGEGDS